MAWVSSVCHDDAICRVCGRGVQVWGRRGRGVRLSLEPFTDHAYDRRIPYMKIAMIAALNNPATGTVTNQATKMFRKRCQSTAFRERIQPTATTEPTCRGRSITVKGETPGEASQTLTSRVSVVMSIMSPEPFTLVL